MVTIRPFERPDVFAVADLLRRHPPGSVDLHEGFLSATLLDHPWADPDLPSLVALDGGEVVGFIGAQARRLKLDDRDLRAVCCSHLVVEPGSRPGAAAVRLLRRLLSGPQDITFSDTANEVMLRMWKLFGGWSDQTRACDWMLALRPLRWGAGAVSSLLRTRELRRDAIPVGAVPLQAAGPRLLRRAFPVLDPSVASRPASPAAVAEHSPAFAAPGTIRPAHDAAHLEHLLGLVERTAGRLLTRIVVRDGQPIGWYACAPRGTGSRVLHLAAQDADVEAVVGEMVERVRASGATVLSGRFEPHLEEPLRQRLAVLGVARRPVVHARDQAVRALLGSGSALISQLDGEWFVL